MFSITSASGISYILILLVTASLCPAQDVDPERQWSQYRGYLSSGSLDGADLPDSWNIETDENIRWNLQIPGLGLGSPVVWGDKLFITTAISSSDDKGLKTGIYGDIGSVRDRSEHAWKVYCINKYTGEVIWERISHTGIPEQKRHSKSSHANCSVATDGKYVVTFFGSEGLYCYDMEGNLIWKKDFGVLRSVFFRVASAEWEFASSPIIYDGRVIIQCDVMENSFVASYDLESGREIWKKGRDEYPGWCTPNIYLDNGKRRIVVNGYKHRGGYDFESGEEIWRMSGGGDIQIPTPVVGDNLLYFNSAHGPQSPILAVRKEAAGDITLKSGQLSNKFVKWSIARGGSYMQTLLLYEGLLYNLEWNGRLSCFNAETGQLIYKKKLGISSSFTASPVVSDRTIFIVDDEGMVYLIKSGRNFEVLSIQKLNDVSMVTPAITDGIIFFRTQKGLVAVGKK